MSDQKFSPDEIILPASDVVLSSLSLAALGAVVRLTQRSWQADGCLLPDDDAKLARLAGATPDEWAAIKDEVRPLLSPAGPGRVVIEQSRARWEVARSDTFRRLRAGKAGAAGRWRSGRNAVATRSQCDRMSKPSIKGETVHAGDPRIIPFVSASKLSHNGENGKERYKPTSSDVERVFGYFKERLGHPRALLTSERSKILSRRLQEEAASGGDPVLGLMAAVDGALVDPWFNGTDPQANGRRLWGFENVFVHKGRDRIEKLQQSAKTYSEPMEVAPGVSVDPSGSGTIFPAAGERGTVGQRMARNAQIAAALIESKRSAKALLARKSQG